jgi:hypothetical protein
MKGYITASTAAGELLEALITDRGTSEKLG